MSIYIRLLAAADIPSIVDSFEQNNWHKPAALFEQYYSEQVDNLRWVWVAFVDETVAGYVTLTLLSKYAEFRENQIPEISDLNILPHYRNQGLGTTLLDNAEEKAFELSDTIGIGFGLYVDYGSAQRLYINRGYIPDGNGITYNYEPVKPGASVPVDDDLVLWFTKGKKQ